MDYVQIYSSSPLRKIPRWSPIPSSICMFLFFDVANITLLHQIDDQMLLTSTFASTFISIYIINRLKHCCFNWLPKVLGWRQHKIINWHLTSSKFQKLLRCTESQNRWTPDGKHFMSVFSIHICGSCTPSFMGLFQWWLSFS